MPERESQGSSGCEQLIGQKLKGGAGGWQGSRYDGRGCGAALVCNNDGVDGSEDNAGCIVDECMLLRALDFGLCCDWADGY